jgi:hypothetical protein
VYCHEEIRPFRAECFLSGYADEYLSMRTSDDNNDNLIGGGYERLDDKSEQRMASFADKDGRVLVTEHGVCVRSFF